MLDREQIKAHFRFLDTASDAQLRTTLTHLSDLFESEPQGTEEYYDLRFLLRHLRSEIHARAAVLRVEARRRAK